MLQGEKKHKQTMTISFFAPAAKCQLLLSSIQSNVIQRRVAAPIILPIDENPVEPTKLFLFNRYTVFLLEIF